MSDTAAAQLRRILNLMPEVADGDPHPIDDVAARLGVSRDVLFSDLVAITKRFDEPGAFVEGVSVEWENDSLSVVTPHFRRPMRLTMRELCALELGLSILRREWPMEERAAIDRALERLRGVITKLPTNELLDGVFTADAHSPGDEHLPVIRQAITAHRKLRLAYRSGASAETRERTIEPYRLVFASGMWYLVARADGTDDVRFFRLDRVESLVLTDERFEPSAAPSDDGVASEGRMFSAEASEVMIVRYSPRIARWIAEREDGVYGADGSFVVRHPLADLNWGARHVLQYGTDAEALAPPELRVAIAEALGRMSSAQARSRDR